LWQNVWYGLSLGSVLLLAAIGLAITFGVMGVINMAHGEMVMLGAYTTFVVQEVIRTSRPACSTIRCHRPAAAFLVAGAGRHRHRARHHPLPLRPAAGNAARDLGPVADPAAGGAHDLRPDQPRGRQSVLDVGRVRARRLTITWNRSGSSCSRSPCSPPCWRCCAHAARPADARRDAEPPHGRLDGHPHPAVDALTFGLGSGIAGIAGVALSQIDNVSPNLGQSYIIDSFMVVVFGGVGNLWGTLVGALTLGIANKFLEPYAGAVLGKILILVSSSCSSRSARAACSRSRAGRWKHDHAFLARSQYRRIAIFLGVLLAIGRGRRAGCQPAAARRASRFHVPTYAVRCSASISATRCSRSRSIWSGAIAASSRSATAPSSRSAAMRWACI
jgi:urea transport system permease protein